MSEGRRSGAGVDDLDALAARARAYLAATSVSRETAKTYARLVRDYWTPLCERERVDPLAAPPETVVTLFRAARSDVMRRTSTNSGRTGALSPGYIDTILAAVKHSYELAERVPPQTLLPGAALAELRDSYATHHALTAPVANGRTPLIPMTLPDYRDLCRTPAWTTREEAATAVTALLSLETGATATDLAALQEPDVVCHAGAVEMMLGGREVRIECRHAIEFGIVPVCVACLVDRYLTLPPTSGSGSLLDTRPDSDRPHNLGVAIGHRLRLVAQRWPAVRVTYGVRRRMRLEYDEYAEPRARVGTQQGIALASTSLSYAMLRTKAVMKLGACAGLVRRDAFTDLTCGAVNGGRLPAEGDPATGLDLALRHTVQTPGSATTVVPVVTQDDPTLCAVAAVREWLLIRDAAAPQLVGDDEPLFPHHRRWWETPARRLDRQGAVKSFALLQVRAGLAGEYRLGSARELYTAQLVSQRADEMQIHHSLRLRKPGHSQRASSRHGAADVGREIARS